MKLKDYLLYYYYLFVYFGTQTLIRPFTAILQLHYLYREFTFKCHRHRIISNSKIRCVFLLRTIARATITLYLHHVQIICQYNYGKMDAANGPHMAYQLRTEVIDDVFGIP